MRGRGNIAPISSPYNCITGYWLVSGCSDRGNRWCEAATRQQALTVYRNIPIEGCKVKRGTTLHIQGFTLFLGEGDWYWTKQPEQMSHHHEYFSEALLPSHDEQVTAA